MIKINGQFNKLVFQNLKLFCRYEVAEFQRRVRQNYKQLKDETWVEVCADGSLEEVENKLLDIVNKELAKERGGVSKLWQVQYDLLKCLLHEE